MKKSLLIAAMLLGGALCSFAGLWTEDFDAALTQAKESGKYVLVDFSGSDWCGWCKKLDKEVFGKKEFKEFAKDNLVCVLIDFPRQKPQSNKKKEANQVLMEKYAVKGFPTILLFSPQGDVAAATGYEPGGVEAYIKHLQGLIDQNKIEVDKKAKESQPQP
ncbi:MAG: thioredoxin family protein [bacterium]